MATLRSPNHGGLYAPPNPRKCNMPGGPCEHCELRIERIDAALAAEARASLSKTCPDCGHQDALVSHASQRRKTCNGCTDTVCIYCGSGARYFCPLPLRLPAPPSSPLLRQTALGVQSPKAEEKGENK